MKRPTKSLLLDAAEKHFSEKGYRATSMEDIAGDVGIRPSAIYKHFRNKQDLYEAVLDRLVLPFFAMLEQQSHSLRENMAALFDYQIQQPNLARLALHATLGSGDHRKLLIDKWYRPLWQHSLKQSGGVADESQHLQFMTLTSQLLGYAALAPLNAEALECDPLASNTISHILQRFDKALT